VQRVEGLVDAIEGLLLLAMCLRGHVEELAPQDRALAVEHGHPQARVAVGVDVDRDLRDALVGEETYQAREVGRRQQERAGGGGLLSRRQGPVRDTASLHVEDEALAGVADLGLGPEVEDERERLRREGARRQFGEPVVETRRRRPLRSVAAHGEELPGERLELRGLIAHSELLDDLGDGA
jgi:hypothetical protein